MAAHFFHRDTDTNYYPVSASITLTPLHIISTASLHGDSEYVRLLTLTTPKRRRRGNEYTDCMWHCNACYKIVAWGTYYHIGVIFVLGSMLEVNKLHFSLECMGDHALKPRETQFLCPVWDWWDCISLYDGMSWVVIMVHEMKSTRNGIIKNDSNNNVPFFFGYSTREITHIPEVATTLVHGWNPWFVIFASVSIATAVSCRIQLQNWKFVTFW